MPQTDDEIREELANEQERIEISIRNNQSIFVGSNGGNMGTSERAKQWMESNNGLAFVKIVEVLESNNKALKKIRFKQLYMKSIVDIDNKYLPMLAEYVKRIKIIISSL